jgi:hypothetical protein
MKAPAWLGKRRSPAWRGDRQSAFAQLGEPQVDHALAQGDALGLEAGGG